MACTSRAHCVDFRALVGFLAAPQLYFDHDPSWRELAAAADEVKCLAGADT
jgi:hypothetical protein